MNQVALVEVVIPGNAAHVATFVDGTIVVAANSADSHTVTEVSEALSSALGVETVRIEYPVSNAESDWDWNEIGQDLVNSGKLIPPVGDLTLMKGFYRCPACFTRWTVCDTTNEAMCCRSCKCDRVEPYYSGPPRSTDEDALLGLAEHEKNYPDPNEQGSYAVEVSRTGVRHKTYNIHDAKGPANAYYQALSTAGDQLFETDAWAQYDVNYVSPLRVGKAAQD